MTLSLEKALFIEVPEEPHQRSRPVTYMLPPTAGTQAPVPCLWTLLREVLGAAQRALFSCYDLDCPRLLHQGPQPRKPLTRNCKLVESLFRLQKMPYRGFIQYSADAGEENHTPGTP